MSIQAMLDHLDHLERLIELGCDPGVVAEMDHFLKPGWHWDYKKDEFRVVGPDDDMWRDEVRRLMDRLEYHHFSVRQQLGGKSWKLLTWRRDGRGFVVRFGVAGSNEI